MNWTQTIVLSLIQGLTEFLPVSSSAHLILAPKLLGWVDQGLAFDVIVHVGTLVAIMAYFRRDLYVITGNLLETRKASLGLLIILATIPVGLCGLLFHHWIESHLRSTTVIALSTIGFGLLLWLADQINLKKRALHRQRALQALGWRDALWIGLAQAISLIPGASRSGITLTAGLLLGFDRATAARFSFLIAIPVMVLSGSLETIHLIKNPTPIEWQFLVTGLLISAISGYLCIHYFLKLMERIGLWPFVLYRCLLGLGLVFLSC